MKKLLLFVSALFVMQMAVAQLKTPEYRDLSVIAKERLSRPFIHAPAKKVDLSQISSIKEMKPGIQTALKPTPKNTPKKSGELKPYYKRPAGMYVSPYIAYYGEGLWNYGNKVFLMAKPFADYLFEGEVYNGVDENTDVSWDYFIKGETYHVDHEYGFYYNSYWSMDNCPILYALDGDDYDNEYQIKAYNTEELPGGGIIINNETPAVILTVDNNKTFANLFGDEGIEFMYSSKTMIPGGRNADQVGMLSRYYGAEPWGENERGWWFGKNASHVDGMAQCFEKPQHPYLLKNVYLQCENNYEENIGMVVNAPVKMTCKVYKIDEIPDYREDGCVVLSSLEPGELIATGEATLTPTTGETLNGLITFTLWGHDEYDPTLIYEYHPTIDFPIMITIEGYNDPGMEDLVEFSAYVSTDDQVDEGYGELCYLKSGVYEYEYDENGDYVYDNNGYPVKHFTGEYQWRGLNNYFSGGTLTMKTGLSIFIGNENPFFTFVHGLEDGKYLFPEEGGLATKTFEYPDGSVYTTESIDFLSSVPGEDGEVWMTCNGSEELPYWLDISFVDDYDEVGNFTNHVTARVAAEPLPNDVLGRQAIIRFEIPGDYIDYKFMQGNVPDDDPEDVNYDFMVDGIYYKYIDDESVSVTYKDDKFNSYKGIIVIPSMVSYNDKSYSVISIGGNAFRGCNELMCLTIPCTVSNIDDNAFKGVSRLNNLVISGNGDWQAGNLKTDVSNLYIKSEVQSIGSLNVNPSMIYSYSANPPVCNEGTFTGYNGTLHVPARSLSTYFMEPYWCNFVNINNDAVEPTKVTIAQDSVKIRKGNALQLNASVSPSNATPNSVLWQSRDEGVAKVINGEVIAISTGECDIIGGCLDVIDKCHVTVYEVRPDTVLISESKLTLEVNDSFTLSANVIPEESDYNRIEWTSSNPSIATVVDGVVTAVAPGECDIIASCCDKQAICHVIVVNKMIYISLDIHEAEILPNHLLIITPTSTPTSTPLAVSSSEPSVAVARLANGKVQVVGVSEGVTTITVGSVDGTAVADSCIVTVYTELGDVDGDGFVGISDVTSLIDYMLTGSESDINAMNGDLDHDGYVTISDVTELIDMLLSGSAALTSYGISTNLMFDVKELNLLRIKKKFGI